MTYFARTITGAEKVVMLESLLALVLEQTGPISLSQLDLVKAFQEKRTYKTQDMTGFYWIKSDKPVASIDARPGWEQGINIDGAVKEAKAFLSIDDEVHVAPDGKLDPEYLRKVMEEGPTDAEKRAWYTGTPDPRPRPDHYAPTCKICKGDCGQCGGPCT